MIETTNFETRRHHPTTLQYARVLILIVLLSIDAVELIAGACSAQGVRTGSGSGRSVTVTVTPEVHMIQRLNAFDGDAADATIGMDGTTASTITSRNRLIQPPIFGVPPQSPVSPNACGDSSYTLLINDDSWRGQCSPMFFIRNPNSGDTFIRCMYVPEVVIYRVSADGSRINQILNSTGVCRFIQPMACDWAHDILYVGCGEGTFVSIHQSNLQLYSVPATIGSGWINALYFSNVTQTLYGATLDSIFKFQNGTFELLTNHVTSALHASYQPFSLNCNTIGRNDRLGWLFLVCQPIGLITYDEALKSTSLLLPWNTTQCLLTLDSFDQGIVFDNSQEYVFLGCATGVFRLRISSGSLEPYYVVTSPTGRITAMANDPLTDVLYATIDTAVMALAAFNNSGSMQVAPIEIAPARICVGGSSLLAIDSKLITSCGIYNSPLQISGRSVTQVASGESEFRQVVPAADGSGDVFVINNSTLWLLHGLQLSRALPNTSRCVRLFNFDMISIHPRRVFLSCTEGAIEYVDEEASSYLNVTSASCTTPVVVKYHPPTDDLFYLCQRNNEHDVGGIFRIKHATKQFPDTLDERILVNGTTCASPSQIATYGYDPSTSEFYIIAACMGSGLLRFHFHSNGSIDIWPFFLANGPSNLLVDETQQLLWVTGEQSACLWKFPLSNLSTAVVVISSSIEDLFQCVHLSINGETGEVLLSSPQYGMISVDPNSGTISSLGYMCGPPDILYFLNDDIVWSSADSVIYSSCGYFGQYSVFAISSGFRCLGGYEWKSGLCSACSPGYSRRLPNRNFTVSNTFEWPCLPAPRGAFVPIAASSDFQLCPAGTYSSIEGQSSCSLCAVGTASSVIGRTSECDPCPPGTAQNQLGQSECSACPPQFYSPVSGSPSCSYCNEQVTPNSTACLSHVCARNQEYDYKRGVCVTCSLGSQSLQGFECQICPVSWYTPSQGDDCISCDYDTAGLSCSYGVASVMPDHWAFLATIDGEPTCDIESTNARIQCVFQTVSCPTGTCPGGALQLLSANDGSNATTTGLHFCEFPRVDAFNNTLCGATVEGYIPWGAGVARCDNSPAVGLIFGLLALAFPLVLLLLRSGSTSAGALSIFLFFVQITALEVGDWSKWLTWMQFANFRLTATSRCLANWTPYQQLVAELLTPVLLLTVLASIATIHYLISRFLLNTSPSVVSVADPAADRQRIGAAGDITPNDSAASSSRLSRLRLLLSSFHIYRYVSGIVSIFLFCFVQISFSCFTWLNCIHVGDKSVLLSSPTVDCFSSQYQRHRVGVILVIIIFVIGFPVAISILLFRSRHRIRGQQQQQQQRTVQPHSDSEPVLQVSDPDATAHLLLEPSPASRSPREQMMNSPSVERNNSISEDPFAACFGPLYLPYRPQSWYYQPLILVRRALLVLISVMLIDFPAQRFMLFAFMHLFALGLHLYVQPFVTTRFNAAETFSLACLTVLSISLNGAPRPYPAYIEVMSFLCIVPPLGLLLALTLHHQWRELGLHRIFTRTDKSSRPADDSAVESQPNSIAMIDTSVGDEHDYPPRSAYIPPRILNIDSIDNEAAQL